MMRTRTARQLRRQALRHARIFGHKPALISHEGALALYGCYRCDAIMEVWDSPSIVNGPLNQQPCSGTKVGWLQRMAIKLILS